MGGAFSFQGQVLMGGLVAFATIIVPATVFYGTSLVVGKPLAGAFLLGMGVLTVGGQIYEESKRPTFEWELLATSTAKTVGAMIAIGAVSGTLGPGVGLVRGLIKI
jgi:hypothetical protein